MFSNPLQKVLLLEVLLATGVIAGPTADRSADVEVEVLPVLVERIPSITLGSYSLSTTHENDILFNFAVGVNSGNPADNATLELECVDCRTWGTAVVSTTGGSKDESIIGDIISFFENPIDTIVSAFDLDVKISLEDVGGHFEFDIYASESVTYSFPIFSTATSGGIAVSEDISFGLVLFIDLVVSLDAEIDLEAGFEFSFPDGAYVTVDPLRGHIVDQGFNGGDIGQLPITCKSGSATFKASLRVRVQAGTTVEVFGTGFDFELAVYADLIEYEATLETTPTCELSITESVDVNIGAYAHAVVEIDYSTFGAIPTAVTTVLDVPLPSLCVTRPTGAVTTPSASGIAAYLGPSRTASTSTTAPTTSLGGLFLQGSSSSGGPTATITGSASLTTSTVYSTDLITITSCSSTVLHCPASLTSEIVVTSSTFLYTTVCPVGQVQPVFTLSTTSASATAPISTNSRTPIKSPVHLTPCGTTVVSTIFTPTYPVLTYHVPTATVFPVPYPNWNATAYTSIAGGANTAPIVAEAISTAVTAAPTYSSSPLPSNATVAAKTTSASTFTGAGSRSIGSSISAVGAMLSLSLFALI